MRNRAALVFFVAAIVCTLIFGFLIIKENASEENTTVAQGGSCATHSHHFNKDLRLTWADSKYFVSFDKTTKKIQLNSWFYASDKLSSNKISEISLVCETPGYNCFTADTPFAVTHFKPPYGVISVSNKKVQKVLPFAWDSKQDLRLGSPMNLCGTNIAEIEHGQYFWIKDKLFFYDYKRNVIGSYDMNRLAGVTPSSAPVDARKIMTITAEGFIENSTCEAIPKVEALESFYIHVEKTNAFVFKRNFPGVFYSFDEDFLPLFKTTAPVRFSATDDDHKIIYFSDAKNMYSLNETKLEETLVDEKKDNLLGYNVYLDANTPVIFSTGFKKILSFNSKKFLGGDEIKILNLTNKTDFSMTNTFNFTRKNIDYFYMGQLSADVSYYFIQREGTKAEFSAINCPLAQ
jgi:hypothetical protein